MGVGEGVILVLGGSCGGRGEVRVFWSLGEAGIILVWIRLFAFLLLAPE